MYAAVLLRFASVSYRFSVSVLLRQRYILPALSSSSGSSGTALFCSTFVFPSRVKAKKKNSTKIQTRSVWISNLNFFVAVLYIRHLGTWIPVVKGTLRCFPLLPGQIEHKNYLTWKNVDQSWPFPVAALPRAAVFTNAFINCQSASKISQPAEVVLLNWCLLLKLFLTLSLYFPKGIPDECFELHLLPLL